MNDVTILKLAKKVEPQLIGILISRDLVEYNDNTIKNVGLLNSFNNIRLKGTKKSIEDSNIVTYEWIEAYRELFPSGRKGDHNTVRNKIIRFLKTDGFGKYTLEDIFFATKSYIQRELVRNGKRYIFKANNIIYKRDGNNTKEESCHILPILDEFVDSVKLKKSTSNISSIILNTSKDAINKKSSYRDDLNE